MKLKTGLILGITVSFLFLNVILVSAQETSIEPETQELWGEVISVDTQRNELLVKGFDFETDIEKAITINVNNKTTYTNVESLNEIMPQDTVYIDYVIDQDSKNIAKNILHVEEKFENSPTLPEKTTSEISETMYERHWRSCSCGSACACPKDRECKGYY